MRTSIFLFGEHSLQACSCGRNLSGSYVELDDDPPGAARRRMYELRGDRWSHEVNGAILAIGALVDADLSQDPNEIRRTHQRIPAHPPESGKCFCGELGKDYRWARARGAS